MAKLEHRSARKAGCTFAHDALGHIFSKVALVLTWKCGKAPKNRPVIPAGLGIRSGAPHRQQRTNSTIHNPAADMLTDTLGGLSS